MMFVILCGSFRGILPKPMKTGGVPAARNACNSAGGPVRMFWNPIAGCVDVLIPIGWAGNDVIAKPIEYWYLLRPKAIRIAGKRQRR